MAGSSGGRTSRLGCVVGIVALLILLASGFLLSLQVQPVCAPGPCANSGTPLGIPELALDVLFVLGAVGTAASGVQTLWRMGAVILRRMRG